MRERDGERDQDATAARVEELLRHFDGPVIIRPLDPAPASRSLVRTSLASAAFVVVVVLAGLVAAGALTARRQQVAATPQTSALGPNASTPMTGPTVPTGGDFSTPDGAASAIGQALEGGNPQLVIRAMAPAGWYARWYGQTQTDPMAAQDAANWILSSSAARWQVDTSHVRDAEPSMPTGEKYITAVVADLNGWAEQRADIMLGSAGGRWYWSSLLLLRPPPISASSGEITGYATLVSVTDASVTVRFRTIGSRCCSDESWSSRTVVLRRESRSAYGRPGGDPAASLSDSGATSGGDVWVRFRLDSLDASGTYGLVHLVTMYPL
jgi:hypothetical protein